MGSVEIVISKSHNYWNGDGYSYRPSDYEKIYETALEITKDHEIATDIASWCELASVGEKYEIPECTIFVLDGEEHKRELEAASKGW